MKKFALLTAFLLFAACMGIKAEDAVSTSKSTDHLKKTLKPHSKLQVRSLVRGVVAESPVSVGQRIDSGQLLLRLDSSALDEEIAVAREEVKKWETILFKRRHWKVRSERAEQQAERKVKEFTTLIEAKEKTRSRYLIHSLGEGRVADVAGTGAVVSEDQVVATILDDRTLNVVVEDMELTEMTLAEEDGRVVLTIQEQNMKVQGTLKRRGTQWIISVSNEGFRLKPGVEADVPLVAVAEKTVAEPVKKIKRVKSKPPVADNGKKLDFEIAVGLGYTDFGGFFDRAAGIDVMMAQYAANYQIEPVVSGEFNKNLFMIPLQALVNYRMSRNWFLKGGIEFAFGTLNGEKSYQMNWGGINETHQYSLSTKINYLMPQVGVETRFASFGVYGMVGFQFMQFSDSDIFRLSGGGYTYSREDTTNASASGFGLLLGGKYRFEVGKRVAMVAKLEAAYIGVGTLSGDRDTTAQDSEGRAFSETVNGAIYSFEANPFGSGWYPTWRLEAAPPTGDGFRSAEELRSNFYSLRLLVGILF